MRWREKPPGSLIQIHAALADGIAPGVVLADAAYGYSGELRAALAAAGLTYAVGIQSHAVLWPAGKEPLAAKDLALSQPAAFASLTWRAWREGSKADLTSRFASFRVRVAARDCKKVMSQPLEWLLVEWLSIGSEWEPR